MSAAARLMARLGLDDDDTLTILGIDPLSLIAGETDHLPQAAILDALTAAAAERLGESLLRRWLRATGPAGRPLDLLLAGDFAGFEDALALFVDRGLVLRGGRVDQRASS